MKKTTYIRSKSFFVNSKGILIKMLQVNSGKIRMNSKILYIYIYIADIYIFMSLHICGCVQLSLAYKESQENNSGVPISPAERD